MYVLEGAEPRCTEFHTWFKVDADRYRQAWTDLLTSARADPHHAASLDEALAHAEVVRHLSLRGQKLGTPPAALGRLRALVHLDVSHCDLTDLPTEFACCAALERLEADFN